MNTQRTSTMRTHRWLRWWHLGAVLMVAALLLQADPATAQQWNRSAIKRALQVRFARPGAGTGTGNLYDSGSGTVLDADRGIILTNYHVMGDTPTRMSCTTPTGWPISPSTRPTSWRAGHQNMSPYGKGLSPISTWRFCVSPAGARRRQGQTADLGLVAV